MISEPGIRPNSFIYHRGDGYYYTFNGGDSESFWFRCSIRSCYGTAKARTWEGLQHLRQHNHPPQLQRHNIQAIRRLIVDRAASPRYVSLVDIVREERQRIPNRELRAQLTYRRLRSAMQRRRLAVFPNVPVTMRHLTHVLENPQWEFLTKTLDNEESIYCCSVTATDGMHNIIFLSARCTEILRQTSIIFLDGTFKITPAIGGCYQVFTIVTINLHTVIPLVWCLMEAKTESAYIAVLLQIRARLIRWNFRLAVSDYEDAIINAVDAVFGVEVQGCFFHYVKALGSWARTNLGAQVLQMIPQLVETIRKTCALPLLPQNMLMRGMNIIRMEALLHGPLVFNIVNPYLEYVERDWISHVNRGRTLSVCGSEHRTNNASESNNYRMKRRIGVHHPNIYHFIGNVAEFEASSVDDVESLRAGLLPNRHRTPSAISRDETIMNLTSQLEQNLNPTDEEISHFLAAAAYSVQNVMIDALGLQFHR